MSLIRRSTKKKSKSAPKITVDDMLYSSLSVDQKLQKKRADKAKKRPLLWFFQRLLLGLLLASSLPLISYGHRFGYVDWESPRWKPMLDPFIIAGEILGQVQAAVLYSLLPNTDKDMASFYSLFAIAACGMLAAIKLRQIQIPLLCVLIISPGPLMRMTEFTGVLFPFLYSLVLCIPLFILIITLKICVIR